MKKEKLKAFSLNFEGETLTLFIAQKKRAVVKLIVSLDKFAAFVKREVSDNSDETWVIIDFLKYWEGLKYSSRLVYIVSYFQSLQIAEAEIE
ncbi:MAG: hypothetical protein U5L45_00340 [Saprospiraceae bacterium]|nr:hypothetical protein [Saprospiraceae bacterium]